MSLTKMPKIQTLVKKNKRLAVHKPGTNVLSPMNSSWKPCWSQRAWVVIQRAAAARPRYGRLRSEEVGR